MNKTIVVFTVLVLGGCGGMQQKEPAQLEPFVANEALIKGETLGEHSRSTPAYGTTHLMRVANPKEGIGATLSAKQGRELLAGLVRQAAQLREGKDVSLQNLTQTEMPQERRGPWSGAAWEKPRDLDYTRFEFDLEKKRKWAINIWGRSDHEGSRGKKEEENGGVGLRFFYDENSFFSADFMRNSARGLMRSLTWGRELELLKFWGYKLLWVGNLSLISYEIPGRGTLKGIVPIPALSVKNGDWAVNAAYLRDGNRDAVLIGFLSWFF